MLGVDHVRAHRRGKRLILKELTPEERERALGIATTYLDLAGASVGESRADFDERCAAATVHPRDRKLAAGLLKLVTDRCSFEAATSVDPAILRRAVFERASAVRAALPPGTTFSPAAVLAEVAARHELDPAALGDLLYVDLKAAHRMTAFEPVAPEDLLAAYELGQAQALLLRATRVRATVSGTDAGAYRALFHRLKFLRLLTQIHATDGGGYEIEIDGPFTMFGASTKYGLQLALALPALRECGDWQLEAEVLWGKDRKAATFTLAGAAAATGGAARNPPLSDDLAALVKRIRAQDSPWRVTRSRAILHLPGVGLCVPDLVFTHAQTKRKVYFEALGYWSRAAVWKRVELVEAGLPTPILFAVSDRLRVSKEALGKEHPSSLYVYKGVMNATQVLASVDELGS